MHEIAIYYFVLVWVSFAEIDLIVTVARGPVLIDPIAKLIVATVALIVLIVVGHRRGGLLPKG